MPEPTESSSNHSTEQENTDRIVDPLDLVYKGGYAKNPREIIETPGAVPESPDQAPEDLRGDLMDDDSEAMA